MFGAVSGDGRWVGGDAAGCDPAGRGSVGADLLPASTPTTTLTSALTPEPALTPAPAPTPVLTLARAAPAPAAVPDEATEQEVDRELVDLLCDDPTWLEETFRDIVATSWDEPPRGGSSRSSARPRRYGVPARRTQGRSRGGRSQWWPAPHGRQRSPPRGG